MTDQAARRAAAYLRVSSAQQAGEDRFGYDRQINDIRTYAEQHDLTLTEEYRDAITGKSVTRAGLQRLKEAAREYDAVIISSVDRLARDVGASYQVLAHLVETGVEVHSADFGRIDLEDDASLIQFNLRSLFSHLERQKITRRTYAARVSIAKSGRIPNGLRALGIKTIERRAIIIPPEAQIVRDMYERSARGESLKSIARHLTDTGAPRHSSARAWRFVDVAQMLKNPLYRGEYHWGRYRIPVPAIVDEALWSAGQPRRRGRPQHKSPLRLLGHVRCGQCGLRLTSKSRKRYTKAGTRKTWNYICQSTVYPDVECTLGQINSNTLEQTVEQSLRTTLRTPKVLTEMLAASIKPDPATELARLELDEEDARWLEAFRAGAITAGELAEYRADVQRRRRALANSAPQPQHDVAEYARKAEELPLEQLLDEAAVMVIVKGRDEIDLVLNAENP